MSRLTMKEVIEHCERVTKRIEENVQYCREWLEMEQSQLKSKNYLEHKQTAEWLKELQRYKDLADESRLIELPCKVGDTVYRLHYAEGKPYAVLAIKIKELAAVVSMMEADFFGKRVFLTKAEAEAKLAELQSLLTLPILHGNVAPTSREEAMKRFGLKDKMEDLKGGAE